MRDSTSAIARERRPVARMTQGLKAVGRALWRSPVGAQRQMPSRLTYLPPRMRRDLGLPPCSDHPRPPRHPLW
ncbi:hypothetical protein DDE20_16990 [Pararhodobacter oceanensis]|uniref:Uncharacterized protein n=1 Tax=Pararhodobacter oceanensis TaxID=2172121 RepID=A0A2T8HPX1_9RHOB|nr:hypothetical protein DDE20_16990 [Pararhodobacter oceanensis]